MGTVSASRSFIGRFAWVLFYPAFFAAAALPVVRVLGVREAVGFAAAALAWLIFGRLIVFAVYAFPIAKVTSPVVSRLILSVVVDGIAIYAVYRYDVRCMWGALAAIAVAEILFWSPERSTAP
jgi:hypothetical protein